jgi:hypothetical protein
MNFKILASGKRVALWGASPDAAVESNDLNDVLTKSGGNTGNMLIGHGLLNSLECRSAAYTSSDTESPEIVRDLYDVIVIPASNFVNPMLDLGLTASHLRRTGLPIVCFGLGSQILPRGTRELHPNTLELLHLLSERSGSIGVRGAFTAEVLWDLGIRNVSIVGCPSLMAITPGALRRLRCARPSTARRGFNYSSNVRQYALDPEAIGVTENRLFQHMVNERALYFPQNEHHEIALLQGLRSGDESGFLDHLGCIAGTFGMSDRLPTLTEYLRTQMRIFDNVPDWVTCMASLGASLGTRFHGNIASLMAGVPALFMTHDMRTDELCRLLRLPHARLDRPYHPEELLERLPDVDYTDFVENLPALQTEWKLFLNRNGLDGRALH